MDEYATIIIQLQRINIFLTKLTNKLPVLNDILSFNLEFLNNSVNRDTLIKLIENINIGFITILVSFPTYFYRPPNNIQNNDINRAINNLREYFHPISRINCFYEYIRMYERINLNNPTVYSIDDILFEFRKVLEQVLVEIAPDESVQHIINLKKSYSKIDNNSDNRQ